MSDINLPTKSEINGDKEKESEVITLNIYNNNINFTETTDNINQTEENLYIKDNYNNLIKQKNNNIVYYDNVREKSNNYPLSENRGIQPPTQFNNNKYYKSFNPYIKNNNYQNNNNNNKYNMANINYINNEEKKLPIIYHPKSKSEQPKQPKKAVDLMAICCIGTILFFLFPPCGIIYCVLNISKGNTTTNTT